MYNFIHFLISSLCSRVVLLGHFHGSVFVSIYARIFLESMYPSMSSNLFLKIYIDPGFLADSPFVDDLDHIVRCFDKTTKLLFSKAEEPVYIKFGSIRDNDKTYNIRFGQLKLMGSVISPMKHKMSLPRSFRTDVALFFEASVNCIIKAVLNHRKSACMISVSHVLSIVNSSSMLLTISSRISACCSRW